ncbi:hypothetical protein [Acerihabitans sp.]|uniref:hypothetical protein n=1 Tax=Acerihabitans sp. TaxID=2811394 RepID=UPI002EDB8C13
MPSTIGIDLLRGRPVPAIGSTDAKLRQRKLDALTRGIHRISDDEAIPYSVHLVCIGAAANPFLRQFIRQMPDTLLDHEQSRLSILSVDMAGESGAGLPALPAALDRKKYFYESLSIERGNPDALGDFFSRHAAQLQLEYPLIPSPETFSPWLTQAERHAPDKGPLRRAYVKAMYSRAYYHGERPAWHALKRFSRSVGQTETESVVCIVFSLADAVGSAMALDLSRHLSTVRFGRRILVTGIGIAPSPAAEEDWATANVYTALNELECLCNEELNQSLTPACGELFKNPFTAGFLMVPDLDMDTPEEGMLYKALSTLLQDRAGAGLWEILRQLNWLAAPLTQHSAARTPWGGRWLHVLVMLAVKDASPAAALNTRLGIIDGYEPAFIELVSARFSKKEAEQLTRAIRQAFGDEIVVNHYAAGTAKALRFVLPCLAKSDLRLFARAKARYDACSQHEKRLCHALLLEQGLLLCEPSDTQTGVAARNITTGKRWINLPYPAIRGEI